MKEDDSEWRVVVVRKRELCGARVQLIVGVVESAE
jgi:hypothetical protein